MPYAMTRAEREAFLAETRVAMMSVAEPGRGPFTVPVWYEYEPGGEIRIVTGGSSKKMPLLRAAGRMSLCVQDETAPYRYVSVEGPVAVDEPDFARDVRATAIRYLGEQVGEMYLAMTVEEHRGAVLLRMRPERWMTVDFRKMV